jgi:predicted aconitase with swiveling domain
MRYGLIGLLVIACTGLSLRAQDAGSPAAPSQAAPSQADQMLNDILKPTPVVVSPSTRPSDLAILQPQGYVPTPKSTLLREGSDVIAREGRLHKVADSPYPEFIFDNKPPETKLDRMLVLPNLQLMSMEDAAAATHADLTFTVSGTVTEYQGKNYILLEPGPDEVSKQIPAPVLTVPSGNGPVSADQMLNQMLSSDKPAGPAPTAIPPVEKDATSGAGAIAAGAPVVNVLREQSQIFDRVGRLSLGSDGQQESIAGPAAHCPAQSETGRFGRRRGRSSRHAVPRDRRGDGIPRTKLHLAAKSRCDGRFRPAVLNAPDIADVVDLAGSLGGAGSMAIVRAAK